jgi:hypothetical protein
MKGGIMSSVYEQMGYGTSQRGDEGLNLGSARSDYGEHAYGGRLDNRGLERSGIFSGKRGAGIDWNTGLLALAGIAATTALAYMIGERISSSKSRVN